MGKPSKGSGPGKAIKSAPDSRVSKRPLKKAVPEPEPSSESEEEEEEDSDNNGMPQGDGDDSESQEDVSGSQEEDDEDEDDKEGDEFPTSMYDREDEDGSVEDSQEEEEDDEEGDEKDEEGQRESTELDLDNPVTVRERIDAALAALANLKARPDKSKSRADILSELATDLSEYYGYIEELAAFLLELFSPAECVEYMDASDRPRPLVIRTNTLKTTRKDLMEQLGKRGANVEGIEWSKVAIKVTESAVPIGATPEYLAGHYMLQSAASLNPVMALAPKPGERVLDMSAAPGGKTTYIAQLMKNSGVVIANDLKPARQKSTVANLHRMGVKNSIVCCYDGRKVPGVMKGFDRVLLDAPCSGLGVISRDQTVKIQRTVKDIQRISHLQKELLLAAIDCVDHKSSTGGVLVYSTCSISCEENEQVVQYALRMRFVKLLDTGLEVGKSGFTRHKEKRFHPSMALTRRFYPHVHNMDGFYVAKFQKLEAGEREAKDVGDGSDEEGDGAPDSDSADGEGFGGHEEAGEDDEEDDDEEEEAIQTIAKKSKRAAAAPASSDEENEEEDEEDEEDEEESASEYQHEEESSDDEPTPPPKKKVSKAAAAAADTEKALAKGAAKKAVKTVEVKSGKGKVGKKAAVESSSSSDSAEEEEGGEEDDEDVRSALADSEFQQLLQQTKRAGKELHQLGAAMADDDSEDEEEDEEEEDEEEEDEEEEEEVLPVRRGARKRMSIQEIRRLSANKKLKGGKK